MTSVEFKQARSRLRLSVRELGVILNVEERIIRKWQNPDEPLGPHPVAVRVMQWMLDGYRPPEFPH